MRMRCNKEVYESKAVRKQRTLNQNRSVAIFDCFYKLFYTEFRVTFFGSRSTMAFMKYNQKTLLSLCFICRYLFAYRIKSNHKEGHYDENVLFFISMNKQLLVGDHNFSFTLNRRRQ